MYFRRIFIHLFELAASTEPSSMRFVRSLPNPTECENIKSKNSSNILNKVWDLFNFELFFRSFYFIFIFCFQDCKQEQQTRPATTYTTVRAFHWFPFAGGRCCHCYWRETGAFTHCLSFLFVVYLFKFGVRCCFFFFFVPSFGVPLHPQLPLNKMQ